MSRKHSHAQVAPAYTGRLDMAPVPALRLPDDTMNPDAAYRFIHDELMLDGSSRLNLATFVTTWMDDEAGRLMAETFDKNMIDKDEYPATAAIEQRCVCMVADLFHAEDLRDDDPSSHIVDSALRREVVRESIQRLQSQIQRLELKVVQEENRPLAQSFFRRSARKVVHFGRQHRQIFAPNGSIRERVARSMVQMGRGAFRSN